MFIYTQFIDRHRFHDLFIIISLFMDARRQLYALRTACVVIEVLYGTIQNTEATSDSA